MPVYEYQCRTCHAHIEKTQRITESPLKKCPECGGKLQKLISLSSFQLKGSGWYATDYARKNGAADNGHKKNGHPDDKGESESTAKTNETKSTEAKTDEPKSTKSAAETTS